MSSQFRKGLVSFVVPVWNRADVIESTLNSIRRQSYRPLEVIVVDDGSVDDTREVVSRWVEANTGDDFQCRCLHQENQGQNVARNTGLGVCSGEFIQFMDSDDLIHRRKVELGVEAARQDPDVDIVVSWVRRFTDESEVGGWVTEELTPRKSRVNPERPPRYASIRWDLWQPLFRHDLIVRCGMLDDIRAGGSYAYMVRLKLHSRKTEHLPYSLSYYRQGLENSMVRCSHHVRVSSNLQTLRCIADDLERFGITDACEWKELTRFAFRTYRRAIVSGDRDLRSKSHAMMGELERRWSRFAATGFYVPESVLAQALHWGPRVLRTIRQPWQGSQVRD